LSSVADRGLRQLWDGAVVFGSR